MTLSFLSIIRSTAAIIVNVTVFPTNLVPYPYVRFMLCNLAHSFSAEKVNHEQLCTAARWTLCQNSGAVQRSCGRDRQPSLQQRRHHQKPASYRAGSGHGAQAELRGEPLTNPIHKSKKCLCTMPTCSAKGCGTLRTPRRPTALTSR